MTGNEFDRSTVNPKSEVARVFPPEFADALRMVTLRVGTEADRLRSIDELTDEMMRRGLCRPRHDMGRF